MSNFFFRLLTLAPLSMQARCCILVRCGLRLARQGFDFSCWHIAATGDGLRMIGTSNLNTWYGWPYQVPPSLKPEVQAQQVQPRSSWNSCGNLAMDRAVQHALSDNVTEIKGNRYKCKQLVLKAFTAVIMAQSCCT